MADKKESHPSFCPQFAKEVQDLRLYGGIQRSCRFIGNHELWV
jgi:hypothetical protein